jgi:hypothetical protein
MILDSYLDSTKSKPQFGHDQKQMQTRAAHLVIKFLQSLDVYGTILHDISQNQNQIHHNIITSSIGDLLLRSYFCFIVFSSRTYRITLLEILQE